MTDLKLKVTTYTDEYGTDVSIDVDHDESFATPEEAELAIARFQASLIARSPEVVALHEQVERLRDLLRRVRYGTGTDAVTDFEIENALRD